MPDCPDDAELLGFLNESLAGERLGRVSGHVDGCALCQERLDRLTERVGSAVARYKELSSGVLPDARSGAALGDNTLVLGARSGGSKPTGPPSFTGLPQVPGFDLIAEIGRGGMGVVYKARHRRLNRMVALKMILAGAAADPRVVQRFMFEAEVLARIQHPHVVQVFEVGTYQGPSGVPVPYLAMELLEGGSLSRKLRDSAAAPPGRRWPSPRAAAALVEGLARAVHAAHARGVIHRDLKPGNVLFPKDDGRRSTDGEGGRPGPATSTFLLHPSSLPKVMDFGLAKFTREAGADLTHSGQLVGTPQYMAPEQAAGGKDIGPAADVYALGAILFECLAGRPPFAGGDPMSVLLRVVNEPPPNVRALSPAVPRDLAAVTMKCLEKDPARRYPSAEALADDLRQFVENRPTRARPVRAAKRLWLWVRRNPAAAGLVVALAAVVALAFALVAALWVRAEHKARDEFDTNRRLERAEEEARAQAGTAKAALQEAERQKARLAFDRAVDSCEEGRVREGLAQFLWATEIAENSGEADLARAARVNLAAWPRVLPPVPRALPHPEPPRAVAFHPDGKRLVTAGRGGEVRLWDAGAGTVLRVYKPAPGMPSAGYSAVAVSPDGNTIAAGGADGFVTVWAVGAGEPLVWFRAAAPPPDAPGPAAAREVSALGFTANAVLWSNDGNNGLKRWDLAARPEPVARAVVPRGAAADADLLLSLAVSPDGKRNYTGHRGGPVREWDADTAAELRAWPLGGAADDVAVSADGARLAATGPAGTVWTIDLAAGTVGPIISLAGASGNGVAFAPRSPYLVASDGDGNVRFWHRETGQPIGRPMRFRGAVVRPRFRADADLFAVPGGGAVHLAGVPDPPGRLVTAGTGTRICGLDYAPAGDRLAVADERRLDLFDPATGSLIQTVPRTDDGPLAIRFDPDPARPTLYRGTRTGLDRIPVPAGRPEPARAFGPEAVTRVEAARRGGLFAATETRVTRFDRAEFKAVASGRPIPDPAAGVALGVLAVRPDGEEVLASFADRVVFLRADTLGFVRGWSVGDELLDARYTPDGTRVLVARRDNTAELLDAATGRPATARPLTHTRAVTAAAVSPDGTRLLTGSRDGTARFWDAATGLPLGPPLRHNGPVTHTAFAPPTGALVATGTGKGHVMVWAAPPPPAAESVSELRAKWGEGK